MQLVGARGQIAQDVLYVADGVIAAGGTPQLVLQRARSRSYLLFQNNSSNVMYLEIGGARATATLSGGAVASFAVSNGGFGYVKPPKVVCLGGGPVDGNAGTGVGAGIPSWPAPSRPAQGVATIAAGVVTAIAVSDPGAGYLYAPYVFLQSDPVDAVGVANPFFGSVTSGFQILPAGALEFATQCPTDAIAVYGTATNDRYACRYMY